jgi:hypothetical protein
MVLIGALALTALGAFAGSAPAATLYVSTTGSDARTYAQAQSLATPLRTVTKGIQIALAGDVVRVRGGIYATEPTTFQNVPARAGYVTVTPYGAERAGIDRLTLANVSKLRLEGFVQDNIAGHWAFRNWSDLEIRRNTWRNHHAGNGAICLGPQSGADMAQPAGERAIIESNTFTDGASTNGIIGRISTTKPVRDVIIRNNLFGRITNGDWIQLQGNWQVASGLGAPLANITIEKNTFRDVQLTADQHADSIQIIAPSDNVRILNNRFERARGIIVQRYPISPNRGANRNFRLANNLSFDPPNAHLALLHNIPGGVIVNNTAWGEKVGINRDIAIRYSEGTTTTDQASVGVRMINNVVRTLTVAGAVGFAEEHHNLVDNLVRSSSSFVLNPADVTLAPTFVNPSPSSGQAGGSGTDYRLRSGSRGVDAGAAGSLVPGTDIDYLPRVGIPDMGAHELQR